MIELLAFDLIKYEADELAALTYGPYRYLIMRVEHQNSTVLGDNIECTNTKDRDSGMSSAVENGE